MHYVTQDTHCDKQHWQAFLLNGKLRGIYESQ
jgi:hypothetical protein